MRRRLLFSLLVLTVALATCSATCLAGRFNRVLSIGDRAPAWSELPGIDGKQHGLAEYKQARLIVVAFICTHCPMATAYEDRLIGLQKDYLEKGVQLVAICVSNSPADKLDKMQERAASKKFNFPYLHDASQKSGASYGATVTPQVFVLDAQRKVAYMGAIDDHMSPGDVRRHYLRDALDALLAGRQPAATETRPVGCEIEYETESR